MTELQVCMEFMSSILFVTSQHWWFLCVDFDRGFGARLHKNCFFFMYYWLVLLALLCITDFVKNHDDIWKKCFPVKRWIISQHKGYQQLFSVSDCIQWFGHSPEFMMLKMSGIHLSVSTALVVYYFVLSFVVGSRQLLAL